FPPRFQGWIQESAYLMPCLPIAGPFANVWADSNQVEPFRRPGLRHGVPVWRQTLARAQSVYPRQDKTIDHHLYQLPPQRVEPLAEVRQARRADMPGGQ